MDHRREPVVVGRLRPSLPLLGGPRGAGGSLSDRRRRGREDVAVLSCVAPPAPGGRAGGGYAEGRRPARGQGTRGEAQARAGTANPTRATDAPPALGQLDVTASNVGRAESRRYLWTMRRHASSPSMTLQASPRVHGRERRASGVSRRLDGHRRKREHRRHGCDRRDRPYGCDRREWHGAHRTNGPHRGYGRHGGYGRNWRDRRYGRHRSRNNGRDRQHWPIRRAAGANRRDRPDCPSGAAWRNQD